MEYHVVHGRIGTNETAVNTCYLIRNTWDDFGFKTLFEVVLFDQDARRYDLGSVRIMQSGMEGGYAPLPPSPFEALDESYCSIGSAREYYIEVAELPLNLRRRHLAALRDGVADPAIFEAFRDQRAMRSSLLRDVSARDVTQSYPRILSGDAQLTPFRFWFDFPSEPDREGLNAANSKLLPTRGLRPTFMS